VFDGNQALPVDDPRQFQGRHPPGFAGVDAVEQRFVVLGQVRPGDQFPNPVLHAYQPTRQVRMNHVLSGLQLPRRQLGREADLMVGHHRPVNKLLARQQFAARHRR
jgi:hypothetical protein